MIYEFITPSDPITFKAPNDAVAFFVGVYLGRGKAGVTREDGERVGTMLIFADSATIDQAILDNLGMAIDSFYTENKDDIAEAFESFAYGGFRDRLQYDDAISAITDPEKLTEFKARHEDRQRSSMSKWVDAAWRTAKSIREIQQAE